MRSMRASSLALVSFLLLLPTSWGWQQICRNRSKLERIWKRMPSRALAVLAVSSMARGAFEFRLIERGLGAFHFTDEIFFGPLGQILGHFSFGPAQQERTDAGGESATCERVCFGIEILGEVGFPTQGPRLSKRHDAPEVQEPILHRGAAEGEPMLCI